MKISTSDSGNDEHQPVLGLFHFLELAAPDGAIRCLQDVGRGAFQQRSLIPFQLVLVQRLAKLGDESARSSSLSFESGHLGQHGVRHACLAQGGRGRVAELEPFLPGQAPGFVHGAGQVAVADAELDRRSGACPVRGRWSRRRHARRCPWGPARHLAPTGLTRSRSAAAAYC